MMRNLIYSALFALSLLASAHAASFDCALAVSRIDNAICASPQLSKLDGDLDAVYKSALSKISDPDALKAAQRDWLKETRNACQNEACMVTVYQQRIAALSGTVRKDEIGSEINNSLPGPSNLNPVVDAPTLKASDVALPGENSLYPATPTSAIQTNASLTVATPIQTNIQSTEARKKETHDRLTGVIVLSLIFGSILAFLVARKHAKWKIALSAMVLLIVIASYFAPPSEPEISYSVVDLDAKLTGRWTTYDGVAPACPGNRSFFIRQADGTMEITGDDGQVINKSMWTVERVYDKDLGAIRIEHPGRAPIYWVVQFLGQDMKTSIMLDSPPAKKSEALEDLAKSDPQYPDIKLPMMHRCRN